MAFRFDWTPLHAVASLARQAGEAKASETRFAQNLALRQLQDAEESQARTAAIQGQELQQRNNAFLLQTAAAKRDEERVAIAERRAANEDRRSDLTMKRDEDRYQLAMSKQKEYESKNEAAQLLATQKEERLQKYNDDVQATRESTEIVQQAKLGGVARSELAKSGYTRTGDKWTINKNKLWPGVTVETDPLKIEELDNYVATAQEADARGQALRLKQQARTMLNDPNHPIVRFRKQLETMTPEQRKIMQERISKYGEEAVARSGFPEFFPPAEIAESPATPMPGRTPSKYRPSSGQGLY